MSKSPQRIAGVRQEVVKRLTEPQERRQPKRLSPSIAKEPGSRQPRAISLDSLGAQSVRQTTGRCDRSRRMIFDCLEMAYNLVLRVARG
jgi:hypothetical protein